jgi:hypothetical protein
MGRLIQINRNDPFISSMEIYHFDDSRQWLYLNPDHEFIFMTDSVLELFAGFKDKRESTEIPLAFWNMEGEYIKRTINLICNF